MIVDSLMTLADGKSLSTGSAVAVGNAPTGAPDGNLGTGYPLYLNITFTGTGTFNLVTGASAGSMTTTLLSIPVSKESKAVAIPAGEYGAFIGLTANVTTAGTCDAEFTMAPQAWKAMPDGI